LTLTLLFDADDTLWHNERFFRMTEQRFASLLADHVPPSELASRLLDAERRNLGRYGFGIKGFVLSMIETALDVTSDRVPGEVIRAIVEAGHEMLEHPIELLDGVAEAVAALEATHPLMLVTKGDLLDQERKLAQSGLGEVFDAVEIVSTKEAATYTDIFARHGIVPDHALMIGNSVKSDILPPIEAGGWAVWIPHGQTWELEAADPPSENPRFLSITTMRDLPATVARVEAQI
jgi:putative hydrolase of the HAD superfamily